MPQLPKTYTTATKLRTFDLTGLSDEERQFLEAIFEFYRTDPQPEWSEFASKWIRLYNKSELASHVVYRICQDLEGRLGVVQGKAAPTDYRDCIGDILKKAREESGEDRDAFCKRVGVKLTSLVNLLEGNRRIPIGTLLKILDELGMTLTVRPTQEIIDDAAKF